MDRLDELATFLAILDTGSLAGAARRLRRSPPSVTRILAGLEARLGARLIERSTRRLSPTEAGHRLADHARRLLADYAESMRPDSGPLRGLLRLTAPLTFGRRHVAPVVASFLDAHPSMRVELMLHDRNQDLIAEGLDCAIRIGALPDSGLVVRGLGHVRRLVVGSPDYLARHGTPASPAALAGHATINTSVQPEWRFRDTVVRLVPRLVVNEVEAMLWAVKTGRGLGRPLSYQVAEELAAGTLVRLLPEHEPPPLPVQIVLPSGAYRPPKTRAFLDHAVPALSALPVLRGLEAAPG